MKRLSLFLFFVFLFVQSFAQMSDEQTVKLLKNAQEQGMSQGEILQMLSKNGVTREQLMRIKQNYQNDVDNAESGTSAAVDRMRTKNSGGVYKGVSNAKENKDSRFLKEQDFMGGTLIDTLGGKLETTSKQATVSKKADKTVFGRDIFNKEILTFEPNLNIATPENYILGPGDEVFIDIWGDSEETIRQKISPDGNIVVEKLGPIYLSGLTVKEADSRLKKMFGQIYSAIDASQPTTFIKLSLGQIRSIQVNIMGEVVAPGSYTLPSLATLFHALYSAGGVNNIGTLRVVKVNRGGKEIASVDVYDYLLHGKNDLDISLKDGDVIVVPPYQNLVTIAGKVKRPMIYEMKERETMADLLGYTGGFTGDAYKKAIRIIRKSGREHQVYNVDEKEFAGFSLMDGDNVAVDSVLARFENRIEIRGAVYREGLYALEEGTGTVSKLVEKAEGIRGDAFINRAVLYREKPDLTKEVIAVDIKDILGGKNDIDLYRNDVLYIPSIFDLREEYTIGITGAVGFPGTYHYADNMTIEDLIVQAGGLLESASTVNVDVARRIKNPKSTEVGNVRAENYTFTLKDGLIVDGKMNFVLQPFDEVHVRRSPGYQAQQNVIVDGEVLFGGTYVISRKGERLSDLIKKAGGLTPDAYVSGARLVRKLNQDERARVESTLKLARQGGKDSIDINRLDIGDTYNVGIELEKALKKPGSDYDIVLREGDRLVVPEYNGTVKISGAVMYPNTVVYKKDAKLKYYINQGGGFANRAKKGKVFIVYMNGTVAKSKAFALAKAAPGCEVIVPVKPPRKNVGWAEIMGIASSTTSMAAMVTSILNLTK